MKRLGQRRRNGGPHNIELQCSGDSLCPNPRVPFSPPIHGCARELLRCQTFRNKKPGNNLLRILFLIFLLITRVTSKQIKYFWQRTTKRIAMSRKVNTASLVFNVFACVQEFRRDVHFLLPVFAASTQEYIDSR